MAKKHKKEKHHRHGREGETPLKLVLKVPSASSTPVHFASSAELQPPIPTLTLSTSGGEHKKKKKKKKKSLHGEAVSEVVVKKKHKSSSSASVAAAAAGAGAVSSTTHATSAHFAPLDHHGMPIGEPPALIPASPVKGKRSRSHHHHHHRPHHQQQHAHHHLAAEGAVFHPPLEATSSLDVPASDHHRHHHKKKTKKRKHVEDIAGGREQGDLGQPASKRVKAVQPALIFQPGSKGDDSARATPSPEVQAKSPSPRVTSTSASPTAAQVTLSSRPASLEAPAMGATAATAAGTPTQQQAIHPTKLKSLLQHIHKLVKKKDTHDFFGEPVSDDYAPGYSQIIKKPMDLQTMQKKIDDMAYQSITEYRDDFETMCHNCMTYNAPDTIYYRTASSLLKGGLKIINRDRSASLAVPAVGGCLMLPGEDGHASGQSQPQSPVGQMSLGDLSEASMPAPTDSLLASAGPIKKKRPSAVAAAAQMQRQLAAEITRQAQEAAAKAAERVKKRKFGTLQKDEDGKVHLRLFNPDHEAGEAVMKLVDIAPPEPPKPPTPAPTPAAKPGDKRKSTAVAALATGPYSSFAPVYDSTFAMMSAEESEMLYSSYGSQPSFHYAQSMRSFVSDLGPSSFGYQKVESYLNSVTDGGHEKCVPLVKKFVSEREKKMNKAKVLTLTEQKKLKREKQEAEAKRDREEAAAAQAAASADSQATASGSKSVDDVTVDDIRSLEKLGIDVSFLDSSEKGPAGIAATDSAADVRKDGAPSIVLHSPSSGPASVRSPTSPELSLLNASPMGASPMAASADGMSTSGLPSAVQSPAAESSVSQNSSDSMSSEASPSVSGASTPSPSLSAMLDREIGVVRPDYKTAGAAAEDDTDGVKDSADSSLSLLGEDAMVGDVNQALLDTNAGAIGQLAAMQSKRFVLAAGQPPVVLGGGVGMPATLRPSVEEREKAHSLAGGLTELARKVSPAAVVPGESIRTALGITPALTQHKPTESTESDVAVKAATAVDANLAASGAVIASGLPVPIAVGGEIASSNASSDSSSSSSDDSSDGSSSDDSDGEDV